MFSFFSPSSSACSAAACSSGGATAGARTTESAATGETTLPIATPAIDVVETAQGLILYADLPGVTQSGLEVAVDGDRLTVRGTPTTAGPSQQPVHQESGQRRFERTFVLSERIDRERIDAQLRDGVLRLSLPHRAATAPRRVAVQVA